MHIDRIPPQSAELTMMENSKYAKEQHQEISYLARGFVDRKVLSGD